MYEKLEETFLETLIQNKVYLIFTKVILDIPYKIKKRLKYFGLKVLTSHLIIKSRIRKIANNEKLTILNLHRVGKSDGSTYEPLDKETFIYLIEFIKTNYQLFDFFPIQAKKQG